MLQGVQHNNPIITRRDSLTLELILMDYNNDSFKLPWDGTKWIWIHVY